MQKWVLFFCSVTYTAVLSIVSWLIITDEEYNYDNLIFILYNVFCIFIVMNFVEPRRLLLFQNIYHIILASIVYVGSAIGFRVLGKNTPSNLSLATDSGFGAGKIVLLTISIILFLSIVLFHFYRYCKPKVSYRQISYYLLYLMICLILIILIFVASSEEKNIHIHHYIVALVIAYGLVADNIFITYCHIIALGIFVEGIVTWGPVSIFSI